ncbi:MAG: aminotransferase class I/II-fold pyridoxal phosphate-dependent enzyme [Bacteroidia bacterium]|nr:aminotransferase class I/II-fold pyridoxal phosphate-dependent enzyme [Bacteroidia bacterium]
MSLEKRLRQRLSHLPPRSFQILTPSQPDFSSNDYLGLIHDGTVREILREAPPSLMRGSGGSRYLGGDDSAFHEVEELGQSLWGYPDEKALFFPSGLNANLAFWSSVPQRDDIVIFDREVHVSIRQGLRLSGATAWGFPHNDWNAAEERLKRASKPPFLVVESVYSMRGTTPDVSALSELAKRYEFYLVVDEAHTTFILSGGQSWSKQVGLKPVARLFTFGKAVGLVGALWIGPDWLIEYLRRVGFAGIYTTAVPPFIAWAVREILCRSDEWESRRARLHALILAARTLLKESHISYEGLEGPLALLTAQGRFFPLKLLHPPTVPQPAYRLSLHAHNTEAELKTLCCEVRQL